MNNIEIKGFTKEAIENLESREWKGNVRELENAIERAVVLSNHVIIEAEDLPSDDSFTRKVSDEESSITNVIYVDEDQTLTLEELSKKYIRHIFDKNSGAKEQTAKDLGIDRKTLYRKLKEMNIN